LARFWGINGSGFDETGLGARWPRRYHDQPFWLGANQFGMMLDHAPVDELLDELVEMSGNFVDLSRE
jgi:hypothetical protein